MPPGKFPQNIFKDRQIFSNFLSFPTSDSQKSYQSFETIENFIRVSEMFKYFDWQPIKISLPVAFLALKISKTPKSENSQKLRNYRFFGICLVISSKMFRIPDISQNY